MGLNKFESERTITVKLFGKCFHVNRSLKSQTQKFTIFGEKVKNGFRLL